MTLRDLSVKKLFRLVVVGLLLSMTAITLARISHRLPRLYQNTKENRRKVDRERQDYGIRRCSHDMVL